MISVSRLLCGLRATGDPLRYERSGDVRPVVVWNVTRKCNLRCIHCYASAENVKYPGELTTEQALSVIDDLAGFGAPVVLFSGGEPLLRGDLFTLAEHASKKGIRCVLSTNATLIDGETAQRLKSAGFAYIGVSIDGVGEEHDRIRGKAGSFDEAIQGLRNCRQQGLRTGLRFTINRLNRLQLPAIFELVEREDIPRLCIYHLVLTGRGDRMERFEMSHEETREAMDFIFEQVRKFDERGLEKEILTVDNHTDGVYLYLTLREENADRAEEVYRLLQRSGGNRSGIAIACIDNLGNVHADQFSWHHSFGNVLSKPFSQIWQDGTDPAMAILRNRKSHLKGRCGVCRFLDICNGNLRARAYANTGDWLAPDPGCYLPEAVTGL